MVNQRKIITMTRLALYDKHEGPADRAANDYFRHDYIYRNNLGTRLAVGCGSIIILVIYWLQNFFINEMDLFELNYQQVATDSLMFIVAVLAVYSLIGTIQGTRQYYLVQKRLAQYQALVRQLERLEERTHRVYDDEIADTKPPSRIVPGDRPPRGRLPAHTVRPAPSPGHTAPLVRTGGAVIASGQSGPERLPTGYTRPPRQVSPDATRLPRTVPPDATKPPRPMPPEATRPPRPVVPGATMPPRPAPPAGYTKPHPIAVQTLEKPPTSQPFTPPEDGTE